MFCKITKQLDKSLDKTLSKMPWNLRSASIDLSAVFLISYQQLF